MGVSDLFSKRQRRARGDVPEVYIYDELPNPLRVQVVHIIRDAFGVDHFQCNRARELYAFVNSTLCREYGVFELVKNARADDEAIFNFFLREESAERALDVIEICFRAINLLIAKHVAYRNSTTRKIEPAEAIAELNTRFKESGVGYQFESDEIIRIDCNFLHAEAVKPALAALRNERFKGANQEFLKAHEHYRHGRNKEALVDALKAFESVMKTICALRGWPTRPGDTAKALIATCLQNGLLPSYLETHVASLRTLLESGIPTVRNKNGGHGQGPEVVEIPNFLTSYMLNMTASTILFMVNANDNVDSS